MIKSYKELRKGVTFYITYEESPYKYIPMIVLRRIKNKITARPLESDQILKHVFEPDRMLTDCEYFTIISKTAMPGILFE